MTLARVVGNVVSTTKKEDLVGIKLMIVQPLDDYGKDSGDESIAIDNVGAGVGDLVLVLSEGWAARCCAKSKNRMAPIDVAIAGIIEDYVTEENQIYQK